MYKMHAKIYAIIVTYNRLNLLKECIKSVKEQTIPLSKILVINNGSTDNTTEWLKTQTGIEVINQENLGGAGGFYRGIKAAHEDKADWIWVMDDDVAVKSDCLEKLLAHKETSGCIHPHKYYEDGTEYKWEAYFDTETGNTFELDNISFKNNKQVCYVNIGCFEGMLIKSEVVDKIGYPDERFFIVYDDMVYGFLASMHTNVAYVNDAIIYSKKKAGYAKETNMYLYYYIRNRHLVEEYIDKWYPRANKKTRKILFSLYVLKKFFTYAFVHKNKFSDRVKTSKTILRGFRDYKRKKTGKTF